MMTEHEILLIKKSWNVFRQIDPLVVGDAFYSKLFFDRPELRRMFPREMDKQYMKLIDMLNTIVLRLDRLDELTEEIVAMAQRHEGYGVKPEHFEPVGEALLWTLKAGLGSEWNEKLKEAWIKCYAILSKAMINAADKNTISR
jgi:hemoglobin-like flavoprotein